MLTQELFGRGNSFRIVVVGSGSVRWWVLAAGKGQGVCIGIFRVGVFFSMVALVSRVSGCCECERIVVGLE